MTPEGTVLSLLLIQGEFLLCQLSVSEFFALISGLISKQFLCFVLPIELLL